MPGPVIGSTAASISYMHDNGASVYATQKVPLGTQVSSLLKETPEESVDFNVQAIIVPDSNRLSGGKVAAQVYKSLPNRPVETVIVVSPSHTGDFDRIAICSQEAYSSPLGDVPIDDGVRNELCDEDDDIFVDDSGHFQPTGMDVQLPFLQQTYDGFSVVPLVMGRESPEFCKELGHAVGEIMYNRPTLVVCCADIEEATPRGLAAFRTHLTNLDVTRMTVLLNAEADIRVTGKGAILVAMVAAAHRRANMVRLAGVQEPDEDGPGFAGALIGRT